MAYVCVDYADFSTMGPQFDTGDYDLSPTSTLVQSPTDKDMPDIPADFPQSPIFHSAASLDASPPDTVLITTDSIAFYVHRCRLLSWSMNDFGGLLIKQESFKSLGIASCVPQLLSAKDDAVLLSVILCVIYDLWATLPTFGLHDLAAGIRALRHYGVDARALVAPQKPLMDVLLTHASLDPLEVFAIAAENNLEPLAIRASPYLLTFDFSSLADELARRIGCSYLLRLHLLCHSRMVFLRGLLLDQHEAHSPTSECSPKEQRIFEGAWATTIASLAWEADPDLSATRLKNALEEAEAHAKCSDCKAGAKKRVKDIVRKWNALQRTI
ncbi:hypothetical protein PsYK624_046150 [Phanerochaete sordida]|uniref:BTB domain-containing protein n=1 Tax=Phanerochaete sordida TaxID=48140 RepID=A0A9P3G5M5_9APHY|nr:hypothetical protein PsYK624_046150 [Phanerochaete sordida]